MDEASQAYEYDSKYGQAVELLVSNKLFDKAIDVVCRYHIKVQVGDQACFVTLFSGSSFSHLFLSHAHANMD